MRHVSCRPTTLEPLTTLSCSFIVHNCLLAKKSTFFLKLGVLVSMKPYKFCVSPTCKNQSFITQFYFLNFYSLICIIYFFLFQSHLLWNKPKKKKKDLFCNLHFPGLHSPPLLYPAHSTFGYASPSAVFSGASRDTAETDPSGNPSC